MDRIEYPDTKALVPKRNIRAMEAPRMFKIRSGRTENGFGCGGWKLGGADIEAEGFSEAFVDDFTENTLLLLAVDLRVETDRNIGVGLKFSTPAMVELDEAIGRWANEGIEIRSSKQFVDANETDSTNGRTLIATKIFYKNRNGTDASNYQI